MGPRSIWTQGDTIGWVPVPTHRASPSLTSRGPSSIRAHSHENHSYWAPRPARCGRSRLSLSAQRVLLLVGIHQMTQLSTLLCVCVHMCACINENMKIWEQHTHEESSACSSAIALASPPNPSLHPASQAPNS